MSGAAKLTINESDLSFNIAAILKGIICVEGVTKRGPVELLPDPINNWPQFINTYGGYLSTSDFPLQAQIMLNGGCQLRVKRAVHYTDPSDATTITAVKAALGLNKKIVFSADLVALNKYNLTINAVPIAETTFTTDNATTMALIVTNILASAFVKTAYLVGAHTIIIVPKETAALTLTASVVTLGASQATTAITSLTAGIPDVNGNVLFDLPTKYHGSDYNNLSVVISAASNGSANYFNLDIVHALESGLNQSWKNLLIPAVLPTDLTASFLSDLQTQANFNNVTYYDLSAMSGPLRPLNGTYYFIGGDNGGALVDTDYVGSAGTGIGFYAFDSIDDSLTLSCPELSANNVHVGGSAYTDSRKDMVYFAHLANTNLTMTTLKSARTTTAIDSSYTAFYGGGIMINDPITNVPRGISEMGYVIANMTASDNAFGEWWSFAGLTRGIITGTLGPVNNFGGIGQKADLDSLADAQINMVIKRNNSTVIWGNFTGQVATSKFSQLSVRRFVIKLKKDLRPMLERHLEDPNEPVSWRTIYHEVKAYMDPYKNIDKRALNNYRWDGDQDVNSVADVVVNNAVDVGLGKYKANLFLDIISAIKEIELGIIITPSGVSFTE